MASGDRPARLAGLPPVGVLAELVNDDGTVKRLPQLRAFAARHRLNMISVADLVVYRQRQQLVERVGRGGGAAGAGILSQSIINRPCKLTVG